MRGWHFKQVLTEWKARASFEKWGGDNTTQQKQEPVHPLMKTTHDRSTKVRSMHAICKRMFQP